MNIKEDKVLKRSGVGESETKPYPSIVTEKDLTYELFSRQPEYRQVNQELMRKFVERLPDNFTHIDIATGTGLVPELMIEEATRTNKKGIIIGIDPNAASLNTARKNVPGTNVIKVEFIEGLGQDLKKLLDGKIPAEGVNGVSILDALHEIKDDGDKKMVLKSMADILKPEGLFVFNSAFTTKGMGEDSRKYGKWKLRAMNLLSGNRRDKQMQAMPIHSPEEYRQMIENAGLNIECEALKTVMLTEDSLIAISMYIGFSNGVFEDMPGHESIPLADKSNALIAAAKSLNIDKLSRVWYELIATKSATPTVIFP